MSCRALAIVAAAVGCNPIVGLDALVFDGTTSTGQGGGGEGGTGGQGAAGGAGGAGAQGGAAPSYADTVLAHGAVAYWRLDETAPPNAVDSAGDYDGDIIGGVELLAEGAIGGNTAACFDGDMTRILIGDVLDFIGTAPFTFEVWVKPLDPVGSYNGILCKDTVDVQGFQGQQILWHASDVYFERASDGHQDIVYANGAVLVDSYHHVVVTYDTINLVLYVDGAERGTQVTSYPVIDLTQPLVIGARSSQGGNFLGCLDEVAIYDVALTEAQVVEHHDLAVQSTLKR